MANLSITSICNRVCRYCFAKAALNEQAIEMPHMSGTTFQRALDFLDRSGIDQARLLGGEPTLHPDFTSLVDQAMDRGLRLLVFSNGLMPETALRCLEKTPVERAAILINVAIPGEPRPEEQEQQLSVFRSLGPRVCLGLNIHTPLVQLDFMLDLIREFSLGRTIRLGLAHPCVSANNEFLHARYYAKVGQEVISFAERVRGAGVDLEFDCGFVPCMFPMAGLKALGKTAGDIGLRCNPILDVLSDGSVVSCFPLANVHSLALPSDHDAMWLKREFEKKWLPYRSLGIFRECSACRLKETGECMGGCLAAAMRRLRYTPSKFTLQKNGGATARPQQQVFPGKCREAGPVEEAKRGRHDSASTLWNLPYIDQPLSFWERIAEDFATDIKEVYCPLPGDVIGSGRPAQPAEHLDDFLRYGPFACSVVVNPVTLPRPAEELAPMVIEGLRRLVGECGLAGATVSNLVLAARIRESLPGFPLTASVLMDIALPNQALMLNGICGTLVPASRIMRDLPALKALQEAFSGRIRLIVNEACLPGCPFRVQHFHEMGSSLALPRSLCAELLGEHPWMRLTGAWVLPQHLHLYEGVYDELKMAGRVTLCEPADYVRVLEAYVRRQPLLPNEIGGGPASVLRHIEISEEFFANTLSCQHNCHKCSFCQDYYTMMLRRLQAEDKI